MTRHGGATVAGPVLLGARLAPAALRNVVIGDGSVFDPKSYQGIRDDLDTLMGDLESAASLVVFAVTRESESTHGGPNALGANFVGTLFAAYNLLNGLKREGSELVNRMMRLERISERVQP